MNGARLRCRLLGHKPFPTEAIADTPSICVRCGQMGV